MNRARRLMKNTLLLSSGGIIMRGIELCFRAYLAVKIGAEGMGVYGLVMSVYMVFATVSVSGIRFCVTRLCAESVGRGDLYPTRMMKSAFLYCLFFGLLSGSVMLCFSEVISAVWIGENFTLNAVRILALSLPPMAIQAATGGYFTGKEKIFRLVAVQFVDSAVRIAVTILGFKVCDVKNACSVLAAGETAGEYVCTLFLLAFYFADVCGKKRAYLSSCYGRRILKTALPLAVSAYTRTGLSSLGHMLIPIGLRKSGLGKVGAFAAYGVIHQMAFPIILFPSAILSALGEVLVPLFTNAQVQGRKAGISYMANRSLRIALIFSTGIAGFMYMGADELSKLFYKTADAGRFIRLFSFLIPVMYLDSVTDGCLKGLGQQMYSMTINIADAFLNVLMLYFLLPLYAVNGYIVTVFICEIMNFVLSLWRLYHVTQIDSHIGVTLTAVLSAVAAQWTGATFGIYGIAAKTAVFIAVYMGGVYLGNGASREDFKWIKALYFEKNV